METNKILAIAINEYDDPELNQIQNCKSDLDNLIHILTEKYIFEDVDFIYEKAKTTRKALFNSLNEYFVNCLPKDNVLLVFAGHGHYNEQLKTAYWQPSDADPKDSSTWLSIVEILTFIKASKAFHIGFISDSCFSGAIFEPMRGGGIGAFKKRKSRLGLTSGGIEKVSDGEGGENSPFAKSLIGILQNNKSEEFPFTVLATDVISDFTEQKAQTPRFGQLPEVGHEGGSFVFKLKSLRKVNDIDNKNEFLKNQMGHLYIEVSQKDLETIDKIKPISDLKSQVVKKQKYEEAAKLRDEEKALKKEIFSRNSKHIDSFISDIEFSKKEIKIAQQLDRDIEKYKKDFAKTTEEREKRKAIIEQEIIDLKDIDEKDIVIKAEIFQEIFGFYLPKDPAQELFKKQKAKFIELYKQNIIQIYRHMYKITSTSKSEFLENKIKDFKELLFRIYNYEINLLIKSYGNELDEIMSLKQVEVDILNWIKK